MHRPAQDLRYGLRMLKKDPGFTATAVFTLALGVGATTAIFSLVYGVLLRPLPYRHSEQIVRLWEQDKEGVRMNFADPNFEDVRGQTHCLQGMAEYGAQLETVSGAGEPSRTMTAYVSRDFLSVMGVQPVLGALALTHWLQSQFFEVTATDPATFFGVALLLIFVSLIACWIPGRLAARVDPMVALRYE